MFAMQFIKGAPVWYQHEEEGFRPGKVEEQCSDDGSIRVVDCEIDGVAVVVEPRTLQKRDSARTLRTHVDDMSSMGELSDSNILHNLKVRYQKNEIYTNIGTTLVAVNPYKRVGAGESEDAPGIRQTVRTIYEQLMERRENHSCVVTGESGAGKTESVRTFVNHLAKLSIQRSVKEDQPIVLSEEAHAKQFLLKERIVQVSPILESFGNARTIRNDNSSRFGKWIEIEIDFVTGQPLSANIRNYMLEKSRLVRVAQGERNFHIFYQLLTDLELCNELGLEANAGAYSLLLEEAAGPAAASQSFRKQHPINDAEGLRSLRDAMQVIGMSIEEQSYVNRTLGALLLLGNVRFEPCEDGAGGSCVASESSDNLGRVSNMLSMNTEGLEQALTSRVIRSGSETLITALSESDAQARASALIKSIYHALFTWVTERINIALDGIADDIEAEAEAINEGQYGRCIESGTIGILDAFGFEIFATNSFEQLCINYCNEKMQLHFNKLVFEQEIEEYIAEGILRQEESDTLAFQGSASIENCLALLEDQWSFGIFALIEDELKLPRANDESLLRKITTRHENHPSFSVPRIKAAAGTGNKNQAKVVAPSGTLFTIAHYAGNVTYDITGFLAKSYDPLPQELQLLCTRSSDELFSASFPPESEIFQNNKGRKANKTLGTQFKEQLAFLSSMIFEESVPHFIRCIKPNDLARPECWEGARVLQQIRYAGLLEASSVRAHGFPVRHTFCKLVRKCGVLQDSVVQDFINRHGELLIAAEQAERQVQLEEEDARQQQQRQLIKAASRRQVEDSPRTDIPCMPREDVLELCFRLEELGILKGDQYRVGTTKVFFRDAQASRFAETVFEAQGTAAIPVQSLFRGYLVRSRLCRLRNPVAHLGKLLHCSAVEVVALQSAAEAVVNAQVSFRRTVALVPGGELLPQAARCAADARERIQYLGETLVIERGLAQAISCKEDWSKFEHALAQCEKCERLKDSLVLVQARSLKSRQKQSAALLQDLANITSTELSRRPAVSTAAERRKAMEMVAGVRQVLDSLGEALVPSLRLDEDKRFYEFLLEQVAPPRNCASTAGSCKSVAIGERETNAKAWARVITTAQNGCVAIERFVSAKVVQATFHRIASKAKARVLLKDLVSCTGDLRLALRERNERGLQRGIDDLAKLGLGPGAPCPHFLAPLAQAMLAELKIARLSAMNQLDRLTKRLERRTKSRERQMEREQQGAAFQVGEPEMALGAPGSALPGKHGKQRGKKEKKEKKKTLGMRFSMLRSSILQPLSRRSTQVRRSEMDLLQQAIEKARSSGVTEDSASMQQAQALVERLEILRQCRPGTVQRMFSSGSLISQTSTVVSVGSPPTRGQINALMHSARQRALPTNAHYPSLDQHDDDSDLLLLSLSGSNERVGSQRSAFAGLEPEDFIADDGEESINLVDDMDDIDDDATVPDASRSPASANSSGRMEEALEAGNFQFDFEDSTLPMEEPKRTLAAKVNDSMRRTMSVTRLLPRKSSSKSLLHAKEEKHAAEGKSSGDTNRQLANQTGPGPHSEIKRTLSVKRLFARRKTVAATNPKAKNISKKGSGALTAANDADFASSSTASCRSQASTCSSTGERAKSFATLVAEYGRPPPPAPGGSYAGGTNSNENVDNEPGDDQIQVDQDTFIQHAIAETLDESGVDSSRQRVILERICREREMRKVIESRFWKDRRGLAGPLASEAIVSYNKDLSSGNLDVSFSLPRKADGSFENARNLSASSYGNTSSRSKNSSSSSTSYKSQSSQKTIPESRRSKWEDAISRQRASTKDILSGTASLKSISSGGQHGSITRHSTKAYKQHWEAVSFVSRNVVSTKTF